LIKTKVLIVIGLVKIQV